MGLEQNLRDLDLIRRLLAASREGESFGAKVRRRRQEKRLTLEGLAARTGMAKSYLSQIETGYASPPRDEKVRRIADALDLKAEQLLPTAHLSDLPEDVRAHLSRLVEAAEEAIQRLASAREAPEPTAHGEAGQGPTARDEAGPAPGPATEPAARPSVALDLDALHRSGLLHHLARADDRQQRGVPLRTVPIINKVAAGYPREFTDLGYPAGIADEYLSVPTEMADPNAFAVRVVGDSMEPKYRQGEVVVFSPAAPVHSGDDCFVRFAPGSEPGGDASTFKRVFFDGPDEVRLQPLNERYAPTTVRPQAIGRVFRAAARYEKL